MFLFPVVLIHCSGGMLTFLCVCVFSRIFLAFSNFVEMHGIMANYRIGILSMKVFS